MQGTKKSKAENQHHSARDLAAEALEIAIKNAPLNSEMIKALRLTCKRTKEVADARVKKFTLSLDAKLELDSEDNHRSEAVQRSSLLKDITQLFVRFDFMPLEDVTTFYSQNFSRALGLLNLAAEICSKSLEVLDIRISACFREAETLHACGCILGNYNWNSLNVLIIKRPYSMPGFLSGALARNGSMPVLKKLFCVNPTSDDIQSILRSGFVGNLTILSIEWSPDKFDSNREQPTVAAMRNLLQKATNIEKLSLYSSTFEFLNSEELASLKQLSIGTNIGLPPAQKARVDFAPALARPWPMLESLYINGARLKAPDLVRIFEAEDTLPALNDLAIVGSALDVDAMSCVRRPRLKKLCVKGSGYHVLISKLAQLMKVDTHALPSLREFKVDMLTPNSSHIEALSEFLSCPAMALLETLGLLRMNLGVTGVDLLYHIAIHCPKLKELDLHNNNFGRSSVALFVGHGHMGAWPELKKLGILGEGLSNEQPSSNTSGQSFMPQLDIQTALRRAWPGLECF